MAEIPLISQKSVQKVLTYMQICAKMIIVLSKLA